jgi:hypothetical protein
MSNRTNLTLSATTNRLNLGSRSLVLTTGQNDMDLATLRFRHAYESHPGISARWDRMIMQPQPPIMPPAFQPSLKQDSKRGTKDCGGSRSFDSASGSTSWLSYTWRELVESSTQGCMLLEAPPIHHPVVVPDVPRSVRVTRPRPLRSDALPRLFAPARAIERADLGIRSARTSAALAPAAPC